MQHKGVFQDFKVLVDGCARHLGIRGDVREIDDGGIAVGGHFEKSAEGCDVPGRAFCDDFLLQIGPGIGTKIGARVVRKIDGRQPSVRNEGVQVKVLAQFSIGEGMQIFGSGPSA